MAKMGRPPKPRSNVYTILALVAAILLGTGFGLLYKANTDMTGESNPMHIYKPSK